jgi:outer membrane immunogenic protein
VTSVVFRGRTVALAVTIVAALSAPAFAAPPFSWDGFYAGGNIGIRTAQPTWSAPVGAPVPMDYDYGSIGARLGLYGGYNWQVSRTWVAGFEVDAGFASQKTQQNNFLPGIAGFIVPISPGESSTVELGWDASIRGRLGYLITPSTMLFGTAGFAWQQVELHSVCILACGIQTKVDGETVRPGWTIGAGIETAITGNWFARAEYRYADFGKFNVELDQFGGRAPVELYTHTATVGLAYRFGANGDATPPAVWPAQSAPVYRWAGAHVGVSAGARFGEASWTTHNFAGAPVDNTGFANYNGTGVRFGVLAGYDWQVAHRWIAGIEGDVGFGDQTTTLPTFLPGVDGTLIGGGPIVPGNSSSVTTTWDASLRVRLGYLLSPSMLAYGTGGAALMSVKANSTCGVFWCFGAAQSSSDTEIRAGWTIGGGIEAKLLRNWRLRTEYRYADYGTMHTNFSYFGIPTADVSIKVRTHTAQVALIYDWN